MPPQNHDSHWTARIQIGGFGLSTIDWPGRSSATIFLQGCPWRCAYCHNPELQARSRRGKLAWEAILARLEACRGKIEGVVFSGGEPTVDRCLPEAVDALRKMGFPVGLHTNGAYPERLASLLPRLDWVGLDLKSDYEHYDALTGAPGSAARVTESARLLVSSGVSHEFRLTWHQSMMSRDAARLAAHFAHHLGAKRFVLQAFHPAGVSPGLATSEAPPAALVAELAGLFEDFELREEICGLAPS